jgi:hypothetical protein
VEHPQYQSPAEFARVIRVSIKTVRRRLENGTLPAEQSGGPGTMWRIDYYAYRQRMACESNEKSAPPPKRESLSASHDCEETIPDPRPKWMRGLSNPITKRGYDSENQ